METNSRYKGESTHNDRPHCSRFTATLYDDDKRSDGPSKDKIRHVSVKILIWDMVVSTVLFSLFSTEIYIQCDPPVALYYMQVTNPPLDVMSLALHRWCPVVGTPKSFAWQCYHWRTSTDSPLSHWWLPTESQ